jgi:D-alanyl-D-alanine carboxypeptidase
MRLLPLASLALLVGCPRSSFDVRTAPKDDPTIDTGLVDTDDPPTTETGEPTDPTDTDTVTTTPTGGDPYVAVPAPPTLSAGALTDLGDELDAIRARTSSTTGLYVVDAENGQELYAHDVDGPKKPASNTKLFTTGLAFDLLGEDHRMEVAAYGDAAPTAQGVVDTLTVVSEHDFTWSTYLYPSESFPAERLADALYDAGVRSVGDLVVAGEYLVEGWSLGTLDVATHRGLAQDVLFVALEDRGIAVASTRTSSSLGRPAGTVELARRRSNPLSAAAYWLNVDSHNEFADVLARHNGYLLGNGSSYDEGAAAVADWLDAVGVDTSGFVLNDGSGLSHDNRVTPRQVVGLMEHLLAQPSGTSWVRTLSIGDVIGTLGSRMTDPDTSGRFYGKTGTLTGVIATSGVLFHRHDGHRYLISVLMNDVPDATFARSLQDDVVAAVGRDRRALGDRPRRPDLRSVVSTGDGRLEIAWEDAADVDDWDLWLSRDGVTWDRSDARRVSGVTSHLAAGLDPDTTWCVRLGASNAAGWSDPSDVACARTASERSRILLVDGDDRWAVQWENPRGFGHDFQAPHAFALGDRAFDGVSHEAVRDGDVDLQRYDLVVWHLGEESSDDETFDDVEQQLVADAVDAGVHLVVSGAEVGWDLDWLGTPSDQDFFAEVLGGVYVEDAADTWTVEPVRGGWFDGVGELGFYTPGTQEVLYADVLDAAAGGEAALRYVGGAGGTAAVVRDGATKVVLLGFPFEAIDTADARAAVMERILDRTGL